MKPAIDIQSMVVQIPVDGESMQFAALVNGCFVGTVNLRALTTSTGLKTVQFYSLFVHQAERRSGVASALLDACEEQGRRIEAETISLWVKPINFEAQEFYRSRGYQLAFQFSDGDLCYYKTLAKKAAA